MTSPAPEDLAAVLHEQPLFADMDRGEIARMLGTAVVRDLEAGEDLMCEDDPSTSVAVLLDGEVEILRRVGSSDVVLAVRHAGDPIGETGVLTATPRNATARARTAARVVDIPGAAFLAALEASPRTLLFLLRTVVARLQATEVELVSQQKLAALGVLAAGLAHELNNPASAVDRSARRLRSTVSDLAATATMLGRLPIDDAALARIDPAVTEAAHRRDQVSGLDPLERSDREERLEEWLGGCGVPQPWTVAPTLVDAGWREEDLEELRTAYPDDVFPTVLAWVAHRSDVGRLLDQLLAGADTISEIVSGVKAYTRLDEAPVQDVDVIEGIDQSLTMLRHRLHDITVHRDDDADLPRVRAIVGELNQAWTNLIENAADAMNGVGELSISTRRSPSGGRDDVVVTITDSGEGLSEESRAHLFEPFFTTKPPGVGTGIGLSITYNVIRRHNGEIRVDSRPGRTSFVVRLPRDGVGRR